MSEKSQQARASTSGGDDQNGGVVGSKAPPPSSSKEPVNSAGGTGPAPPPAPSRGVAQARKPPDLPQAERSNWLIHMHYVRGEFDSCMRLIKEQLTESGNLCEYALYVQGLILRQRGRIQESMDAFQQCALLNPASVTNLKQVARSLFLLGRHRAAAGVFQDAAKQAPDDWEVAHNLGVCYMHMREFPQAKDHLKRAASLRPHESTLVQLGKILIIEGDLPHALDVFRRAVELAPENPDLLSTLGLLYMQCNQYQKAFEHLGNALTYDPEHTKAILAAGSIMQAHGDYDVALTKYRVAAGNAPESAAVWNNIGMAFFGKRKFVAAITCLKRASYLSPFEWKVQYNLGLVHLYTEQYASAFHFLTAAIQLRPNMPALYMLLGVALSHLDDADNCRLAYDEALKMEKKAGSKSLDPLVALNYAVFLYNAGDASGAGRMLGEFERRLQERHGNAAAAAADAPDAVETGKRLAALLNVGESLLWREQPAPQPAPQQPPAQQPSQQLPDKAPPRHPRRGVTGDDDLRELQRAPLPPSEPLSGAPRAAAHPKPDASHRPINPQPDF